MADRFTRSTVVRASSNQVSSQLGDEAVILNVENGVYYGLNPVSARIMELLAEPRPLSDILTTILDEYEVSEEQAWSDLVNLLEKMAEQNLVETDPS
jgi:hypothetical protein